MVKEELPDTINKWLKTVKKARCFRDKLKVYAPTCYGECLSSVNKLVTDLNEIFKGSTVYDAQGSWLDDNGNLETEPIKVIEVAGKCTDKTKAKKFAKALMEYGVKARQKSLGIDEQEFFIARSPEVVKAYVKELRREQ